jgi:hypothetical protein
VGRSQQHKAGGELGNFAVPLCAAVQPAAKVWRIGLFTSVLTMFRLPCIPSDELLLKAAQERAGK